VGRDSVGFCSIQHCAPKAHQQISKYAK
jgi:hypothetical protein